MFSFRSRLPITEEERVWVDDGFRRLTGMLGSHRLANAAFVLPTDEFFPDHFDKDEPSLRAILRRVCTYMQVDPGRVDLEIIPDSSELMDMLPVYRHSSKDPAGLHFGESRDHRALIGIKQSLLQDPLCLIATLAHELAHVILLDDGHMAREVPDMEPMTDLATVFLGLGIFTANSARRFVQFQDDRRQGWSMSHSGYLPEPVYAYALARFARERNETNHGWLVHLNTNVKTWFRQSAVWLEKNS
jgi:hypothetical protein